MSFAIQSKQILELYRYSNNFLSLEEEKGPVPLKVGLIVAEVSRCPCTVQSLYSLVFVKLCLCVRVRDGFWVCVHAHACACMHVHINKNIFLLTATVPTTQKKSEFQVWNSLKDTLVFRKTTRSNAEYRLHA